ncbi:MAG: LytTR family transcriptional regulator [Phenylobacterium sp.]|nr:MAG: LytTR family transcriptional regulator [Phenylobacterium sp.]
MTEPADPPPPSLEAAARRRAFLAAWAGSTVFLLLQNTTNAFSQLRDQPHLQRGEPFVWEYSSGAMEFVLLPAVAWLMLRVAPPRPGGWLRFAVVHIAGSLAFCLIHVSGFVVIRKVIYALAGYSYGGADWLYEYRKDVVSYIGFALIFWLADWAARQWAASRTPAPQPGQRLYHLRDGARVVRVPMDEIVAVTSARNYVEFHLAGGRKPLVRDTLAKVEEELAAAGFLRTHRSWLVNPAHVRAITPAAAGDFRLELDGGMTAPLSRRFPDALESLRTPDGSAA